MQNFTQEEAKTMDQELGILHECLTDLYDLKYNDELARHERIKEALDETKAIIHKHQQNAVQK